MITVAIGRPMAKAMAITDMIAESKSSSGRTLSSSDMAYTTTVFRGPRASGAQLWLTKP